MSSLEEIVGSFEKESNITTEQLASQLMNKTDLSLKTEIPFSREVEITALSKDMCDMIGDLFDSVEIIGNDMQLHPATYTYINDRGESKNMTFGERLAIDLKRKIGYSEEYAVSHRRKGRTEITSVLGKKVETEIKRQGDTLSKAINR